MFSLFTFFSYSLIPKWPGPKRSEFKYTGIWYLHHRPNFRSWKLQFQCPIGTVQKLRRGPKLDYFRTKIAISKITSCVFLCSGSNGNWFELRILEKQKKIHIRLKKPHLNSLTVGAGSSKSELAKISELRIQKMCY